jgi:hypothetical protein
MIPMAKELQMIAIYLYICDMYEKELRFVCQRFSNNSEPEFTDQEIMTIYIFLVHSEQRFKIKQIYDFADNYLRSWFPKLPSYVAFDTRINRLSEAFRILAEHTMKNFQPDDCQLNESILDSLPIITCSGKRKGKVAKEISDKGYCSTKNMYYFGLKLHALGFTRPYQLPFPEQIQLTPASENDLNVFKQNWADIEYRTFYGDKIYNDSNFFSDLSNFKKSIMYTPIKAIKNQPDILKCRDKAYNDLFSTAVSKVRQPIESFFNWIIEKTDIQRASKVRSTKGLLVHVFGKIAAAYIFLIFNP